jgi:HD-GYP domain-containing protein (c-di-GMP phosphodiesterase class II)
MADHGTHEHSVTLARLIARLNADLSPEAVLQTVCDEAAHALGAPAVIAGAYDEQRRIVRYLGAYGGDVRAADQLIPSPAAPAPPMPGVSLAEPGPALVIGLWRGDQPVGALALIGRPELADSESQLLRVIADLAAQAVVNAIRLASAHSRAADLEAINKLSRALAETLDLERIYELLYEVAFELLPEVAGAIFSLFDAERQQITCTFAILEGERIDLSQFPPLPLAPPGQGVQSSVIHTRQPVIVGSFEELSQRSLNVIEVGTGDGEMTESMLYVPMIARERVVGVLQVQSFTPGCFSMAHAAMLGLAANVAAVAIENAGLVGDLRRSNSELLHAYDSTLEGWSRALDLRDKETEGHSRRVTDLALRLARVAGMSDEQVTYVRWGALLHDIGKMGVPDAVLLKPGPLDDEEWRLMRLHPIHAHNLIAPITFLGPALDIPYCHHEKWDGSGYPRGLRGAEIPLAARLFAVVDIWDALRSDRPYRPAWTVERARAHIQSIAGSHLDPAAVEIFFQVLDEGT